MDLENIEDTTDNELRQALEAAVSESDGIQMPDDDDGLAAPMEPEPKHEVVTQAEGEELRTDPVPEDPGPEAKKTEENTSPEVKPTEKVKENKDAAKSAEAPQEGEKPAAAPETPAESPHKALVDSLPEEHRERVQTALAAQDAAAPVMSQFSTPYMQNVMKLQNATPASATAYLIRRYNEANSDPAGYMASVINEMAPNAKLEALVQVANKLGVELPGAQPAPEDYEDDPFADPEMVARDKKIAEQQAIIDGNKQVFNTQGQDVVVESLNNYFAETNEDGSLKYAHVSDPSVQNLIDQITSNMKQNGYQPSPQDFPRVYAQAIQMHPTLGPQNHQATIDAQVQAKLAEERKADAAMREEAAAKARRASQPIGVASAGVKSSGPSSTGSEDNSIRGNLTRLLGAQ